VFGVAYKYDRCLENQDIFLLFMLLYKCNHICGTLCIDFFVV
jgi:hypothetical protein